MNAHSLQAIATSVAAERDLKTVLNRIVIALAAEPQVALTRIWLLGNRSEVRSSGQANQSSDRGDAAAASLHLAASAGTPRAAKRSDWSRLDGRNRRIQLGAGKVGQIAATGESVLLENAAEDRRWIVDQSWVQAEGVISFAGHPLVFRGEILGVLALFSRERLAPLDFDWLRTFADQAAIAIANARAFAEIEALRRRIESENTYLREEVNEAHAFGEIVGRSPAVQKLHEQIELVAPTLANVLILGESGTGKELVAREIHRLSPRRERPLVKVNCAAISRELFESEFFGHVKGAFTGALKDRLGRFQLAHGATLFLDEIGDIPLDLQGKLLRVLQEGQIERVGDDETRQVDVRIIAATHRDLEAEVAAGRFRSDLYFRLSVFPIEVAPLRERAEDIACLAEHFLNLYRVQFNGSAAPLTRENLAALQAYPWPGNIRELQHVIERAVICARHGALCFSNLLPAVHAPVQNAAAQSNRSHAAAGVLPQPALRRLQAENLLAALTASNWKIYGPRGAAEMLGIPPTTLASQLKRLNLRKPR